MHARNLKTLGGHLKGLKQNLLSIGLGIFVFLIQVGVSLAAYMKSLSSAAHSG